MAQCTAKSKQSGERCKRSAAIGRTVCASHGGKTPRGIASPHFVHGERSIDLPTRYISAYEASKKHPDQLNLDDKIAKVDAREEELFKRLSTGESGELWRRMAGGLAAMLEVYEELVEAIDQEEDPGEPLASIERIITTLTEVVAQANQDEKTWAAIVELQDHRRRLSVSEGRRRVQMQTLFTKEQGKMLIGAVAGTVKRHVKDPATRAAIAADLGRLVALGDGSGAGSDGER